MPHIRSAVSRDPWIEAFRQRQRNLSTICDVLRAYRTRSRQARELDCHLRLVADAAGRPDDSWRYCRAHLDGNEDLVVQVKADPQHAAISDKLKALLVIAGKTAEGGKRVTAEDVGRARQHGATDLEIHDTVLIAAAFCMFNRYVDGLATWAPDDPDFYRARAALVAEHGYASATLLGKGK